MWKRKSNTHLNNVEKEKNTSPHTPLWKKVILTTCLGLGITVGSVYAQNLEDQLPTVYHVYMDGEHIGTVNNKNIVDSYIVEMKEKAKAKHDNLTFITGQDIAFVNEKVFRPNYDNQHVLTTLKDELSIEVAATKMEVGGTLIGYFKNKRDAEQALNEIKLKYVSGEALNKFKDTLHKDKEVSSGGSKILDVSLSKEVSLSNEKVSPTELFTVRQAVKLLEKGTLEDKIHTIQSGDVLGTVANNYNLSTKKLLELNPELNEDEFLQIGQKVNVTDYAPYVDVIVTEEKKEEVTIDYEIEVKKSDQYYKGQTKVKQQGEEGKKEVHYKIKKKNGEIEDKEIINEKVLKEPVKKIVIKGTKVIPSRGTGNFTWPTMGGVITSNMGWRWGASHNGIDIAGVSNRTIKASDNGVVVEAGWNNGGYGNKIVINHNNGYRTVYAHLRSINVYVGQTVKRGMKIGVMGTTGDSTGVHLHFELKKNGSNRNPTSYVSR